MDADKFTVRFSEGMRSLIKQRAKQSHRTMNNEIVFALQQYLAGETTATGPRGQAMSPVAALNQPPSRAAASTQG